MRRGTADGWCPIGYYVAITREDHAPWMRPARILPERAAAEKTSARSSVRPAGYCVSRMIHPAPPPVPRHQLFVLFPPIGIRDLRVSVSHAVVGTGGTMTDITDRPRGSRFAFGPQDYAPMLALRFATAPPLGAWLGAMRHPSDGYLTPPAPATAHRPARDEIAARGGYRPRPSPVPAPVPLYASVPPIPSPSSRSCSASLRLCGDPVPPFALVTATGSRGSPRTRSPRGPRKRTADDR